MLPLEKLKVLDLTQVMAGPFCCQVLADMGAVVTKVEPPETGEQSRRSMGFRMKKGEDTAAFVAINRNKKSMTPGKIRRAAPLLGEHTEETLMELGYSKEAIADLRERKII